MSQAACVEQSEHSSVGCGRRFCALLCHDEEGVRGRGGEEERGVWSQGLLPQGLHRIFPARVAGPCRSVTARELCHECCHSPSSMLFLFLR